MTVPVKLANRKTPLKEDSILVRIQGERKGLKLWLLSLIDRRRLEGSPQDASKTQQLWWTRNDKIFPVMMLPPEVRIVLFRHILGSEIHPQVNPEVHYGRERPTRTAVTLGHVRESSYYSGDILAKYPKYGVNIFGTQAPNYNIFRVNRQIRDEALQAGWEGTRKHFTFYQDLHLVISNPNPPATYNWLAAIELDFGTWLAWFDFFGFSVIPTTHVVAHPRSSLIPQINTLKDLRLRFPNPYVLPRVMLQNPWDYFRFKYSHNRWFKEDARYANMCRFPCQIWMVDCLLTFAFPYIKHVPRVRLAEAIKTRQKLQWESILATEYIQRNEAYRTHGYDQSEASKQFTGVPVYSMSNAHVR
jgi:hypothetical protein